MVAGAYFAVLALLALHGAHRLSHLVSFLRAPARDRGPSVGASPTARVTVQLPLYNERTVAARAIRAAGALEWPRERFELQVLDDSTDETTDIARREVETLRAAGVDAVLLRREGREGFKAGALDHGLARAKGELVCVFDSDFVPPPDFLSRLVGHFDDPAVGMVQARWGHMNRDESTLTRAQSTLLDGHFVIEHRVRAEHGLYFNFNGTAGIWRRAAIEGAGGWQHDTLTEDLDLSYRAQLAGWRFVYAPGVVAPAEVPPDIAAFRSQQQRWAKGSAQVLRKLGARLLRADVPFAVKLEALAHLTGNIGYPLVLLLALLLPLTIHRQSQFGSAPQLVLFALCTLGSVAFYERSQRALGRRGLQRLRDVLAAMALGIGMCISQTRAVLSGLFGGRGTFVRTPKRGDGGARPYSAAQGLPAAEVLLAVWLAWAVRGAVELGHWGVLPFLVLFASGFAWVGGLSLREWARARALRPAPVRFWSAGRSAIERGAAASDPRRPTEPAG